MDELAICDLALRPESEDCLTLDVYTTNTQASLPVIVWIYGGVQQPACLSCIRRVCHRVAGVRVVNKLSTPANTG